MPNIKTNCQKLYPAKYLSILFKKKNEMKNKTLTAISAGTSYLMLKLTESSLDPYTRFTAGLAVGSAIVLKRADENTAALFLGIGILIGSALQLIDVAKGGRLIRNQCNFPVYIIGENGGISALEYGQLPSGNIDGFTFKGLSGVFKLSHGIYVKINSNNSIQYTLGLGRFINQSIRSGGFKTKQWVDQKSDLRWKELYDKSI